MFKRCICLLSAGIFCAVATSATSFGQTAAATANTASSASTPVAFVYVSSNYKTNTARVFGYAAAANGQLTPTPDSPYSHNVYADVANGKYLFGAGYGSDTSIYPNIYSFSIGPHGYLTQVAMTDVRKLSGSSTCASPGALTLDLTGTTLYPAIFDIDCSNDAYMSLKLSNATGALTYLSHTGTTNIGDYVPLTFTGNNQIAYSITAGMYSQISGFRRQSNGSLADISIDVPYVTGSDGNSYSFQTGSADSTNHLAVALLSDTGVSQLASYTANESNGNLSTTSTYANMPNISAAGVRNNVQGVLVTSMAPSGNLVAVGGTTGLQVFHFNGTNPPTTYTSALTMDEIDYAAWDNENHLYAASKSGNKLFVFTVTPTSVTQAPGSPYTITAPVGLVVQTEGSAACSAPTSAGVHICSPASGATVATPVQVSAAAKVTGTLSSVQVWIDGVKKYSTGSSAFSTSISVAAGTHRFAVVATNTAGQKWESVANATVQ